MTPQERDQLLDDLLEGDITDADFLRLEAEMIVDSDARVAYYDRLKLQTGLEKEARAAAGERTTGKGSISRGKENFDPFLLAAVGALLLLVGVLAFKINQDTRQAGTEEPVATGFGVIAETSEVQWGNGLKISRGDLVPGEEVHLQSGIIRVELFNGVIIYFAGESKFTLISDRELRVGKGEVQIQVPELGGNFELKTAAGTLSADDAVFSAATSGTEVAARFEKGTGQWIPEAGGSKSILRQLESFTTDSGGNRESDVASLLPTRNWEKELLDDRASRLSSWERSRKQLSKDDRLLAYFSMEESLDDSSSVVKDLSPKGNDGGIIRAERSRNRWGEPEAALDFTPMGSRVRLNIPGDHSSLSLMCWVKIDSLDRLYNSLFLTDGHEIHEPHWQIMNDGRMFFSVRAWQKKGPSDKHIAFSPPIWKPTDGGKWIHLATVFNGQRGTITHYVNGEAVSIDQIPENLLPDKVTIGAASIGNWSEPRYRTDPDFAVRNLNGSIDEFAIFSVALDASEIQSLFESGRL